MGDIWISISQEAERDQNKNEGSLKFAAEPGWPRQMAALNPRTVKMRLKAKLERDEIWVSFRGSAFWRRGGDGRGSLSVCCCQEDPGRLKTFIFVGEVCSFTCLFYSWSPPFTRPCKVKPTARGDVTQDHCPFFYFPLTRMLQRPKLLVLLNLVGRKPKMHLFMAHDQLGTEREGKKTKTKNTIWLI